MDFDIWSPCVFASFCMLFLLGLGLDGTRVSISVDYLRFHIRDSFCSEFIFGRSQ